MTRSLRPYLCLIILIIPGVGLSQEIPDFNAGRPGAAETSTIVPKGYYQVETGWTLTNSGSGYLMVRTGLSNRMECRFSFNDLSFEQSPLLGGLMGGILYQLTEESGRRPKTSLLFTLSIPNSDDGMVVDETQYNLIVPFSSTISDHVSLGWHLSASYFQIGGEAQMDLAYAAALGCDLAEKIGVFIEVYGGGPTDKLSEVSHSLDGGITYQILDNIQIDINGGFSLSNNSNDTFLDFGVAFRLPR